MSYCAFMSTSFKAACIQNSATPYVPADIATCQRLIGRAAEAGARLITLPEYCIGLDTKDGLLYPMAFPERDHPAVASLCTAARDAAVWLLVGSIGVKAEDGRIFNRSLMVDPTGSIVARYDKLHLFDVSLGDALDLGFGRDTPRVMSLVVDHQQSLMRGDPVKQLLSRDGVDVFLDGRPN